MKTRILDFLKRYAVALGWAYFTILFSWLALYLLVGDRFRILGLVNNIAVCLFFPLPIIVAIAIISRRKELTYGAILGSVFFLWFWGALFMPRLTVPKGGNPRPPLMVMTYNVLGMHEFTDPIIDVIRTVDADVVFLQEVNPLLAAALHSELINDYPYQIIDPRMTVEGMATVSRFPIHLTGEQLPMGWVGVPQVMEMDFEGKSIILVNFHTYPYSFRSQEAYRSLQEKRRAQAQILADFASEIKEPIILAGDANDTSLSKTYRIIMHSPLKDAWYEAGFGLGHTFPGSDIPGSSRPQIGPWYVPQWLTRIDYVFVSPHWGVTSARVAPFDGVSDHRGVVAELVLGE